MFAAKIWLREYFLAVGVLQGVVEDVDGVGLLFDAGLAVHVLRDVQTMA